jgi:hypothetical protein
MYASRTQGLADRRMVLLDCTDQERWRRLGQQADPERIEDAIRDGREYRLLGLPVIDTTSRAPAQVAAELAEFIQRLGEPITCGA